jgi:hypothetical protein
MPGSLISRSFCVRIIHHHVPGFDDGINIVYICSPVFLKNIEQAGKKYGAGTGVL